MVTINGTPGDDFRDGTAGADTILGLGGFDTLNGLGGNDSIDGGDQGDWIDGGTGNDTINPGSDSGGFDQDVIVGSTGNDVIDYSSVSTNFQILAYSFLGNAISFSFDRNTNAATVNKGVSGFDTILDLLNPLDNGDGFQVIGTQFGDTFTISNPNGNFWLEVVGGRGGDTYVLAPGRQTSMLNLYRDDQGALATQGAVINLGLASGQIINDGFGFTDTIVGSGYFEQINGTRFADSIIGGAGDDRFMTSGGNDTVNGGAGFDTMRYSSSDFIVVNANLSTGTASYSIDEGNGEQNFTDTLISIEAIHGTRNGNDTITGSSADNYLEGRGGNDSLVGGAGDDTLRGDEGNDTLRGGDGNDNLRGGDGDDLLDGSGGSAATNFWGDFIEPGRGTNTILGHAGVWADGDGIDIFYLDVTGSGGLTFTINANGFGTVQSAIGGVVNDTFTYAHYFHGTNDADVFTRVANDDQWFAFRGGAGNDTITGNSNGTDYVDYWDDSAFEGAGAVSVNLATGVALDGFGNTDTLVSIEEARGSRFNDVLTGNASNNRLEGREGNDSLVGGAGDDTLQGDEGNDTLRGGEGRDNLRGGDGNDLLDASGGSAATQGFGDFIEPGFGSNTILGHAALYAQGEGIDIFYGNLTGTGGLVFTVGANGSGSVVSNTPGVVNDTFTFTHYFIGSGDSDSMIGSATEWEGWQGGAGNDTINGGDGYDSLQYGDDRFEGGLGAVNVDFITGTAIDGFGNTDTFLNIEEAQGTELNDTMTGGDLWVRLDGREGDDLLTGGSIEGAELIGREGNDTLIGLGGFNYYEPGQGNDSIVGGADFDMIDYFWNDPSNGISITFSGASSGTTSNDGHGTSDTFSGIEWIRGTNFGDIMTGTTGEQTFNGLGGVDTINGGAGLTDWIDYGDSENKGGTRGAIVNFATNSFRDTYGLLDVVSNIENVWGSDWGDSVTGINGINHRFVGNGGADTLNGANGNDTLEGGDGDDTISGGAGIDSISGGAGLDLIFAQDGDDIVSGGVGNDTIFGDLGNDSVSGDEGNDFLIGRDGNDTMLGGIGNDGLYGDGGNDSLSGGDGLDSIFGGIGNDVIQGDAGADLLFGKTGFDTIEGGAGNDEIYGDQGNDRVFGGDGNDTIFAGDGADIVNGDAGDDLIYGRSGDDALTGGTGFDEIYGEAGNDQIFGQDGNDTAYGGIGNDTLFGDNGDDLLFGEAGNDFLIGRADNDTLDGGDGNDGLYGDGGNDSLIGGLGDDIAFGGAGDDTLDGGAGNDTLIGIGGNDLLLGGADQDILEGREGADTLDGGDGNDTLNGQQDADLLTGGLGADVFIFRRGWATDTITDFATADDRLQLSQVLWGGGLTDTQVITTFATSNGTDTTFDFGSGDVLVLQGIVDEFDLVGRIDFV